MDTTSRDALGQALGAVSSRHRVEAAYALGRCVPSSAELLSTDAERGVLVERVSRLVDGGPGEARAAWKALAAFGELPQDLPASPLSESPPAPEVELEMVRALATTQPGRSALAKGLASVEFAGFEGPRWGVLFAAIRGLRPHAVTDSDVAAMVPVLAAKVAEGIVKTEGRAGRALGRW